jgi:hypothetical protein
MGKPVIQDNDTGRRKTETRGPEVEIANAGNYKDMEMSDKTEVLCMTFAGMNTGWICRNKRS